MAGIKHPVTAFVDQPEYEKAHEISGYFDVAMEATEPDPPDNGKVRWFFKEIGTSPNMQQTIGIKFSDGSVWILADRTV